MHDGHFVSKEVLLSQSNMVSDRHHKGAPPKAESLEESQDTSEEDSEIARRKAKGHGPGSGNHPVAASPISNATHPPAPVARSLEDSENSAKRDSEISKREAKKHTSGSGSGAAMEPLNPKTAPLLTQTPRVAQRCSR